MKRILIIGGDSFIAGQFIKKYVSIGYYQTPKNALSRVTVAGRPDTRKRLL